MNRIRLQVPVTNETNDVVSDIALRVDDIIKQKLQNVERLLSEITVLKRNKTSRGRQHSDSKKNAVGLCRVSIVSS